MPEKLHDYGLDWIDEDELFKVTAHVFQSAYEKVQEAKLTAPPDPFALAAQAVLFGQDAASVMSFEKLRGVNKTISNAVGNYHQAVLSLADGWENLGATGGVVDLVTKDPDTSKLIYVEVKNRYNTIKASDEKAIWDNLDKLARSNGSVAYIVQIVPKTPERYDRPWSVSGRSEKENVRCCDGATAYEWAFHERDALQEFYAAFPLILSDALDLNYDAVYDSTELMQYFSISMPTSD